MKKVESKLWEENVHVSNICEACGGKGSQLQTFADLTCRLTQCIICKGTGVKK